MSESFFDADLAAAADPANDTTLRRCPACDAEYFLFHECRLDAKQIGPDRCPECGGVYGPPNLAANKYDFPCCCAWPPELVFPPEDLCVNPLLGEQFKQEDGRPAWYTTDGLSILRTTPIRAAFNAPDGRPLFVYPNGDVLPPRVVATAVAAARAETADARAETARLRARVVELEDRLARLTSEDSAEAIARLQHECAVANARREQMARIIERPDIPPVSRIMGAVAVNRAVAYRLPLALGAEPEHSEPAPVSMAEVERIAGAGERTAAKHLQPLAEAGLITREVRKAPVDSSADDREFRSTVLIGPGNGSPAPKIRDFRRERERERLQKFRADRAAREASLATRVAELEAAAEAAERGCPICGGDLVATGYVCKHCGAEHTTATLAAPCTPVSSNGRVRLRRTRAITLDHSASTTQTSTAVSSPAAPPTYDTVESACVVLDHGRPNGNAAEPRQRHTQDHTGLPRGRIIP